MRKVMRLLSIVSTPTHIPDVRLNAAWAITNMSCLSKEVNHMIVDQGGIEALLSGLITGSGEFRLQCIWALGNIAADCTLCKMKCRETSLLFELIQLLTKGVYKRSDDLTNIVCCVQNLVRGGIQTIPFKFVRSLVSSLTLIIRQHRSITALVRKCIWAIAALADDMHAGIQIDAVLIEHGLVYLILEILETGHRDLHHSCLRLLGNIVTGNDEQTSAVIYHLNFYPLLKRSLSDDDSSLIRREAAWICSNIAASNSSHIEVLFTDNDVYTKIIEGIYEGDMKLRKECLWTVANLLSGADLIHLRFMVGAGVFTLFPFLLKAPDTRLVERSLSSLRILLRAFPEHIGLVRSEAMLATLNLNHEDRNLLELKRFVEEILSEPVVPSTCSAIYTFSC